VPAPAAGDAARFDDPKIKVVDMSGDGIQDLAMVRDGMVVLWEHNGNGNYEEGQPILNPPTGVGANEIALQMDDLNNDGQGDLVMAGNRTVTYWLSLGDGSLSDPIVLTDTPAYNAADTAVRLADIDGDGASELLFSSQAGMAYVDFSVGSQPFLLASVDNGRGRTIEITYKSSIEDYITDWDAGQPWEINLPFPVQVVNQVKVHDANSGDDYTVSYHYRDGYYDGVQKEFRGFVRSQEIKQGDATAATTITNLVYDVGKSDESRKGLLLESEVLAEGGQCAGTFTGCLQRTVNQLKTREVVPANQTTTGKPIAYAFVRQTDSFIHEGQTQPVQLRQRFDQDQYGNVTQEFKYGQVCGDDESCGNDEILKYTEYIYNEAGYLFNRPMRIYQTDAAGNLVSESRLYYDGEPFVGLPLGQLTRGDLVREESNLGPKGNNRFIATKRYQIDEFGNQVGIMDGNGNRITVEYDPIAHTFPVVERRHFADGHTLTFAASYHPGFGQAVSATDYNGHPHIFTFDTFGRLAKMVKPGDTLEKPTEEYSYVVGSPRSSITTRKRMRSGEDAVLTSVTYSDGLGRKLQTRTDAGDGKVVVSDAVTFNARQGIAQKFLPYFSTGYEYTAPDPSLPHSRMEYDALERVVRTYDPEGAYVMVIHKPLVQELYDEEDTRSDATAPQTPQVVTYDGLERVIQVEERNLVNGVVEAYRTRYAYDALGNLTQITDAQGNVKTMEYDALSRRLRMVDPNRGETIYTYDDNGNLIKSRDAKGQEVIYSYDAANRLLSERWVFSNGQADVVNAVYHYDADLSPLHPTARNTLGQIAYVEDQAGAVYFSYDPRGNMVGSIRQYKGENRNFVNRRAYDAMDRLIRTTYADGTEVTYEYDAQGLLSRIPGFVDQVTYTASGQRASITFANGARTTYTYDNRQRLNRLQTVAGATVLQDFTYTLDQVGNVRSIADGRPGKSASTDQSQEFGYDSLYRLINATGSYGQIEFGYDPTGNLVRKTTDTPANGQNLGELRYGENGAGPYAVTSANGIAYRYDANGNLIRKGDTTYQWNPRDMLVAVDDGATVSSYQYDTGGKRVSQTVRQGEEITTTLYPDGASEVRGNQLILYVFDDEKRIAEMIKPLDNSTLLSGFDDQTTAATQAAPIKRWYIGDHLGSTHLVLDEAAGVVAEKSYYPFGESRQPQAQNVTPYDYTGKELDVSGLYYYEARYYDAQIGRFISVDPLYADKPQNGLQNPQLLNLYAYTVNNPIKYVDPDGASPQQRLTIPLRTEAKHPRMALVFEMDVQSWKYNDLTYAARKGMTIRANMSVVTQRGDDWVPVGKSMAVDLRFKALPNAQSFAVAGAQSKVPWTAHTVKSTAMCLGNMCVVSHYASGGQYLKQQMHGIKGFYDLIMPNGDAVSLDQLNAEGCSTGMPYFINADAGYEKMPSQHGVSPGVGVNLNGGNVEDASHMITGRSIGSYESGPTLQKAQKPPH
jgi:RHS repeat-associated protein